MIARCRRIAIRLHDASGDRLAPLPHPDSAGTARRAPRSADVDPGLVWTRACGRWASWGRVWEHVGSRLEGTTTVVVDGDAMAIGTTLKLFNRSK
jgi:hypothetical protein